MIDFEIFFIQIRLNNYNHVNNEKSEYRKGRIDIKHGFRNN